MSEVKLHFLDNRSKNGYVTFGVPWKRGEINKNTEFSAYNSSEKIPVQSSPIAYWNDGSVKWTSHTVKTDTDVTIKTESGISEKGNTIAEDKDKITVDNGIYSYIFYKKGNIIFDCQHAQAKFKAVKEQRYEEDGCAVTKCIPYYGEIDECLVEETGMLRSVIKVCGTHRSKDSSTFLRFIAYITVLYKEQEVQIKHTFIYDGDAAVDFIKGVGIEFTQSIEDELYNRHIKLAGDFGVMHEAVQLVNLWRPRLGPDIYKKQLNGEKISFDGVVDLRNNNPVNMADIDNITKWDRYRLCQITPDSYQITKRTAPNECTYIKAGFGHRSKGFAYAGGISKGMGVGMRDFFQKAPSSIYIEGLSGNKYSITAWIIPPDAEAADMRHYDTVSHDQTYYEGFPWVGSTPYGIAATNDISFYIFNEVPSDEDIMNKAERIQNPPVMVCSPEYYHDVKVMGEWSLPSYDTPLKKWIEEELDKAFEFYKNEIEQRRWYGTFDYGDVMHTYDGARHCWKYDMGGYAWQNTELVPTLWLWYAFLRSGRGDIFNVAEAMSRHAADVDVYHLGEYKGIGSRHNVIHWGDSCKEPRIAMAGHHRALYFLSGGDFRIRDVFDDVKDGDYSTLNIDPLRFFYKKEEMKLPTHARSGPDWSTFCSNWYTQWELYGDTKYRDKIQTGIDDLKKAPMRLISGSNFEYDPETGHLGYIGESAAGGSHLVVCMGGPQTWMELADLLDDPEFRDMLIQYGSFYYLPEEEKRRVSNGLIKGSGFVYPYMASAIAAYAARETDNRMLAYQVWQVLVHSLAGKDKNESFDKEIIKNYYNNENLDEMFWISTNFTAQWCLNAIISLEFTKDYLENSKEDYAWEDWVK